MSRPFTTLCLDIGSGTQDALLYTSDMELANSPKFVLPAPARLVARRIATLTKAGRAVYLYGSNMGGGFVAALEHHMQAGYAVAAHPDASVAIHDNAEAVRARGIVVTEDCPPDHVPVYLADFDPAFWQGFLRLAGLAYPDAVMAAAQDHGFFPDSSNCEGRFTLWKRFLREQGGDPAMLTLNTVPSGLTRLAALQRAMGGGMVCDSGGAALLGALYIPEVVRRSHRQGVTVINVGNSHITAFLVHCERVCGVYEHHTDMLTIEALLADLSEFRHGWLPDEQVRAAGGHGCLFGAIPEDAEGFRPTFILGPRRAMLEEHGQFITPGGDMMLAGCFGLLHGRALRQAKGD